MSMNIQGFNGGDYNGGDDVVISFNDVEQL